MGNPWYILKSLLDRPNYTAHRNPECGHMKLKSKPRKLAFVVRYRLGVHVPCKSCGGLDREEWDASWDMYFAKQITHDGMMQIRGRIQRRG